MTKQELLSLYETMLLIRVFEEKVLEVFTSGAISGTAHVCCGQEAVAVGACSVLRRTDYVVSNHRGHGHFIAKGGAVRQIMAELFGKATGYSGGRGGSQHMACIQCGFLGSNGITGGGIPIATGAALSLKLQKVDSVVVCFFGDGAANQGTFHESLNMAAIWNLPIVYICENNLYAMSTHFSEAFKVSNVAIRAQGYGMASEICDGQDVLAVRDTVERAVSRARSGLPSLVECRTYRFRGHSKSDTCEYRTREEENAWRHRDPILLFGERLKADGTLTEADLESVSKKVEREVEDALAYARSSPNPPTEELERSVFA